MHRTKLIIARLLTLAGPLSIVFACGGCVLGILPLSADPIDVLVVDANTGTPLKGVAAVAVWPLNKGSLGGGGLPCGTASVEESVTGEDGLLHFAGWGPIKNPCGGVMREYEPLVYLFKPGYHYGKFPANGITRNNAVSSTGKGWWVENPIKLKKFQQIDYSSNAVDSYSRDYDVLNTELAMYILLDCNWKKIPNMLRMLESERRKFSEAAGYPTGGVTGRLVYEDSGLMKAEPQCGSPKVFLEGLMK